MFYSIFQSKVGRGVFESFPKYWIFGRAKWLLNSVLAHDFQDFKHVKTLFNLFPRSKSGRSGFKDSAVRLNLHRVIEERNLLASSLRVNSVRTKRLVSESVLHGNGHGSPTDCYIGF
jgi:hypothetical protein